MRTYTFSYKAKGISIVVTVPHDVVQAWMVDNDLLPPMAGAADADEIEALMDTSAVRAFIEDLPDLIY